MNVLSNLPRQLSTSLSSAGSEVMFGASPLPMQYLGSKGRISKWIMNEIREFAPQSSIFLDLFAGTGSVGMEALRYGYKVCANDLQPYTHPILNSLLTKPRSGLSDLMVSVKKLKSRDRLLSNGRGAFVGLLEKESALFKNFQTPSLDWEEYETFCKSTPLLEGTQKEAADLARAKGWNLFSAYYSNTYFGVRQALSIDVLREFAEGLNEPHRTHLIAATISVMTFAVSSTTHLAQYLKPSTAKNAAHLVKRRKVDIIDQVIDRLTALAEFPLPKDNPIVLAGDFSKALEALRPDRQWVVYADPPYFKEHYSRYYHVLDTFYLYDYPTLTINPRIGATTTGRYRENRLISNFGKRRKVREEFLRLFSLCANAETNLALSYADTSLVHPDELVDLASQSGLKAETRDIELMHSGQGQPRHKVINEYLILLSPK